MLAKKFRLSAKKDFDQILKSKSKFYSYNFVLRYKPSDNEISRFAIVISKKVSKKAVIRNLIKRRATEIIRLNMDKIKTGFDIMIFAKSGATLLDYDKIEQELSFLFKSAKLFR